MKINERKIEKVVNTIEKGTKVVVRTPLKIMKDATDFYLTGVEILTIGATAGVDCAFEGIKKGVHKIANGNDHRHGSHYR